MATEAAIHVSYDYETALLAMARDKAAGPARAAAVAALCTRWDALLSARTAFLAQAQAARHARGEVYSDAMVRAINGYAPSADETERMLRPARRATHEGEALQQLATALMVAAQNARAQVGYAAPALVPAAQALAAQESAFERAVIDAADHASEAGGAFRADMARRRREVRLAMRSASTAMFCVARPAAPGVDAAAGDAVALGQLWSRFDTWALEAGVPPLSDFIGLDEEATEGSAPQAAMPTVAALRARLDTPGTRVPSKKTARAVLDALDAWLAAAAQAGARIHFEIDL